MRSLFIFIVLALTAPAMAKVSVMFHPYDPTLKTIADKIKNADESVDIAVYNIDSNSRNPIIAAIQSEDVQKRLQNGQLQIRMIFEGYETKVKNKAKMEALEKLGIDVRYMGSSRKMHHKYAIIDGNTSSPQLITGSANWSMSSRRHYNENILFFEQQPGVATSFQKEFQLLWGTSKEFGESRFSDYVVKLRNVDMEQGFRTYFNTANLKVRKGRLVKDSQQEGWKLTRQIADAIDNAQDHIQIATTRVRLRPIYNAIVRAAARGVKVDVVVTMGEYEFKGVRKKMRLQDCEDAYKRECSTSQNFTVYLGRDNYEGHENVTVRYKWFHINKSAYLNKQMHSKYIIIDGERVLSGSFNWSYSAEYNHIENVIDIDGAEYPKLVEKFEIDFTKLMQQNRDNFKPFVSQLEEAIEETGNADCAFAPMALTAKEIDYMLGAGRRAGKSLKKACK